MKVEYTPLMDMEKVLEYYPEDIGIVRARIIDDETGGEVWVLLNDEGGIVGGRKWDWIDGYSDGFARMKKGEKAGMLNKHGNVAVPAVWDDIRHAGFGYMVVRLDKKYGVLDSSGRTIAPPIYDEVGNCSFNCFVVKKDGEYSILSDDGSVYKVQWKCRDVRSVEYGSAIFMDDEEPFLYGLIDCFGDVIYPPTWKRVSRIFDGKRYVVMDGKLQIVRMYSDD